MSASGSAAETVQSRLWMIKLSVPLLLISMFSLNMSSIWNRLKAGYLMLFVNSNPIIDLTPIRHICYHFYWISLYMYLFCFVLLFSYF